MMCFCAVFFSVHTCVCGVFSGNQNILISAELFHFLPTLFLLKYHVVNILCFTSFNLLCFTHEEVVSQGADDQT